MSSWTALLARLGENSDEYGGSADHKDHLETCFGVVRRELLHSKDEILSFLLECAEQLPHKAPLYGTLVGLLNLEDEELVGKIVEDTRNNLQAALDCGDCNRIRLLMRFLTALMCSKVVHASSIVVLFETLLSSSATTVDEDKGNPSWQPCADFYVSCILACFPWGGAELAEQVPEELERVMLGIQAYMSIRKHVSDAGYSPFEYIDDRNQTESGKDFLEDLWDRIQDLSNREWKLNSVPRPHLSFESQLVAGKSHDFGPINCPELPDPPTQLNDITIGKQNHEAALKYPQRIWRLNIFPANKIGDLLPIDRFVVEEYLLDVLFFLNGCRKECASAMACLPVSFRYEHLMAETIFSQILMLPQPPFNPMYYAIVIMDLCKALPGAFPAVVAGAVRSLFDKIADLDMECRTRLIFWFAQHLSNFQFVWPWEEWAHVLDLPKWAPQRVFVQEVLEREGRFSFWHKIKQSIETAPALEELLPPKGTTNFKYSGEDGAQAETNLSAELVRMVAERLPTREIISWVEGQVLPAHGLETTLSVVVQTLLNIGSKSFTHLVITLERYGQVIAKICSDEDKQVMLISEVNTFWKNKPQMTAIAVDRMMGYRLLSNLSIVRWVFSPSNIEQFHVSDRPWEILGNAVNKTFNRLFDLRKATLSLKKSVVVAAEAAAKAEAELENAKSKLTLSLVDGKPVLAENPAKMRRLNANVVKTKKEEVSERESLEAKEALLARACNEGEELLFLIYKSFSDVLAERLRDTDGTLNLDDGADEMPVDHENEDSSAMELDKDGERPQKSLSNGGKANNSYNIGEKQQWCLSTLGYLRAFTRQYASEIWPLVEKLDAEVLTEDVHPLFRKAVYSALRCPLDF